MSFQQIIPVPKWDKTKKLKLKLVWKFLLVTFLFLYSFSKLSNIKLQRKVVRNELFLQLLWIFFIFEFSDIFANFFFSLQVQVFKVCFDLSWLSCITPARFQRRLAHSAFSFDALELSSFIRWNSLAVWAGWAHAFSNSNH